MLRSNHLWWWLIPVLLITATLGIRALDSDVLWVDEFSSLASIGGLQGAVDSPAQIIDSLVDHSSQHMPLFFFLLAGWAALTGWEPFTLRALALFFGFLTISVIYRLVRAWLSPRAGVGAAAVVGLNAFFIYYCHELRMYTMLAFFVALVLWLYWRVVAGPTPPRWVHWAGLWVGTIGLLGTHVYGALVLAAIGLYHLLFVRRTRRWLFVWIVFIGSGLLYLPWLRIVVHGTRAVAGTEPLHQDALTPGHLIWWIANLFSSGGIPLLLILAGCALAALFLRIRAARSIWFLVFTILIFTMLLNAVIPMITVRRVRYLIFLWPFLGLLAGLGYMMLERWKLRWVANGLLAGLVMLGMGQTLNPAFLGEMDGPLHVQQSIPLNAVVRTISRLADADDMFVTLSQRNRLFVSSMFGPSIATYYADQYDYLARKMFELPNPLSREAVRQRLFDRGIHLKIWFAYEPDIAPEILAEYQGILTEKYVFCGNAFDSPAYRVDRYELAVFGCIDLHPDAPPVAMFGGDITLKAVYQSWGDDGQLALALVWNIGETVPPEIYSVSIKLWNGGTQQIAQSDFGLPYAGKRWQMTTLDTADLPPGDYQLTVQVYNWKTFEGLPGRTDQAEGDTLPLMNLHLPAPESPHES